MGNGLENGEERIVGNGRLSEAPGRGLNGPQGASPPDGVSFNYGKELSLRATLLQHVPLVMNVHFEQSFMGAQR